MARFLPTCMLNLLTVIIICRIIHSTLKRQLSFAIDICIDRVCSSKNEFENYEEKMKSWFRKRVYPKDLISSENRKLKFSNFKKKKSGNDDNMEDIRLVPTYHSLPKSLNATISEKHSLFYTGIEIKCAFTPWPLVSFHRKLNSYLAISPRE